MYPTEVKGSVWNLHYVANDLRLLRMTVTVVQRLIKNKFCDPKWFNFPLEYSAEGGFKSLQMNKIFNIVLAPVKTVRLW